MYSIVICGFICIILIFWNTPYLKDILYPFRIFTVGNPCVHNLQRIGLHEFGHAIIGIVTGATIVSITVFFIQLDLMEIRLIPMKVV